MSHVRSWLLGVCAALLLWALLACGWRVLQLERGELELESPWRSLVELAHAPGATPMSVRLSTIELRAGEHALFELCSQDAMDPERWLGAFELAVFQLPRFELMLR